MARHILHTLFLVHYYGKVADPWTRQKLVIFCMANIFILPPETDLGCSCCNLSADVALNVQFTTNGMCTKNNTHMWHEQAKIE